MTFQPRCLATAIGSLPHEDADAAVDVILSSIPDAPIWPQLPRISLNEQMEIQYSEGMPGIVIDQVKRRMYFDTATDHSEDLTAFYEAYLQAMDPDEGTGDCSALAISPDFSRGICALESRLKTTGRKPPFIKIQTTGPCSFALTIVDQDKRAIYYNEEFRDVIIKALAMKCRWQIQKFRPHAERVICFVDEPILSAFGSSTYVSLTRENVVAHLGEIIRAIHADEAIAGVHCCGNTEWSLLIDAGVDIINFDAFDYGETIALYAPAVKAHLERGGILAWGVVPTSIAIREQTIDALMNHFNKVVEHLAKRAGMEKRIIVEQSMVTPSCGTGSMEVADSERVFKLLGELSSALRARYGFL
ncbi:MAG TPA: hypothetical protein VMW38_26260 [Terriglobia bacterium]|nr:hypothetical protein [Terriglobia bacterium]